jgi:hypothetical protein
MKAKQQALYFAALATLLVTCLNTAAQPVTTDSLAKAVGKTQSEVEQLKKVKLSGYVQAQFQKADTAGAASFAGGNFEPAVSNRFMVRRGRLKATYSGRNATGVLQIDVTEKGIAVKDAYVHLTDPWTHWLGVQAGMFNRPFGFEISYSSSNRESPERARVTQSLFPGERDLGAKLVIAPPEKSALNFFQLDVGIFNGAGPTAVDFDSRKDLIARLGLWDVLADKRVKLSGGVSYYGGGVRQSTPLLYSEVVVISDSVIGYLKDSNAANIDMIASRSYVGADAQVTLISRVGETTLRGEFVQGSQPGTSTSNVSPTKDPASATYMRNMNGAYFYFIHTFVRKHQLILKYDWYDPNTDIAGDAIGMAGSNTGKVDIKYTTTGLGYAFLPDKNLRFTIYYDIVKNEISENAGTLARDLPDNVLTLRVQLKFP